jgi:hypothetical protein
MHVLICSVSQSFFFFLILLGCEVEVGLAVIDDPYVACTRKQFLYITSSVAWHFH